MARRAMAVKLGLIREPNRQLAQQFANPKPGVQHFRMPRLTNVATEMSLQVLAYNLKRVITILGTGSLLTALRT